jgi:glyoxylase-like metal-dependent hydrolase (beta-lactamase superfamily II)
MLFGASASAEETAQSLRLQKVTDNIYAIVGPFGNRTPENLGNNATFGLVVTDEGVVLIDSGGSYLGAAEIDKVIKQVTDKPVKIVINSGGQDHRWLGNGYFKKQGARIIASKAAVEDQRARLQDQMFMLGNLIGEKGLEGTEAVQADETFDESKDFILGGINFELTKVGIAHTPGDVLVWLPGHKVMFSGDVVYIGRMLGVQSHSNARNWIEAFNTMASYGPKFIVPGHGPATDLATAKADTLDYLVFLRERVGSFMEEGGDITNIGKLDQSQFRRLQDYETLKGRNAQQVFQEMEWE